MKTLRKTFLATMVVFVAVSQSFASISNVTVSPSYLCTDVTIQATVTPTFGNLESVTLCFRQYLTVSVFIDIDMQPCTGPANTYCATIPAAAFQENWGVQWFIAAKEESGLLQFNGTSESPNHIFPLPSKPNPKTKEMTLHIEREKFYANCKPVDTEEVSKYNGLRLKAYFENDCGELEENSEYYDIQGDENEFVLKLYGDSDPNDGVKNGFYEGDKIVLKVITLKNGYDYYFSDGQSHHFVYQTNNDISVEDDLVLWTASVIEITGNNQVIESGATSASIANGTDFGKSNLPVSQSFTVSASGCNVLYISSIRIDDNVNFSVSGIPNSTRMDVGETNTFTVTYNGTTTATTTVRVYNNSADIPLYTFSVTGEYDANLTAVETTEVDEVVVYVKNRTIMVENASEPVSVFDGFGRCIAMGESSVIVPQAGIYVVKSGEWVEKVMVR
ncbi:MAG: hypothetical protein LBR81_04530 [Prevotellaceae bacterium]|jgi:hypothetical protein|nr:hypothetical protein [Prevotellaceae bacterium]